MGELLGITGAIGSGKSTLADLFGQMVENHAYYETGELVAEIGNRFNQLLEAELNFETTDDDAELVNQVLIWMPDIIAEVLHHDITWNHLAITAKDRRAHPELYTKLFEYLAGAHKTPRLVEQTIDADNKEQYRPLLQWLGGYFVAKISPTIWYDELFRRIDLHETRRDLIIISGVRYISDATLIKERGGRIIAITRPQRTGKTDVTESERPEIAADIIINNNSTLPDLERLVETVWNDIAAGHAKKEYRAA